MEASTRAIQASEERAREYLATQVEPLMTALLRKLAIDRPNNPTAYLLEHLRQSEAATAGQGCSQSQQWEPATSMKERSEQDRAGGGSEEGCRRDISSSWVQVREARRIRNMRRRLRGCRRLDLAADGLDLWAGRQ
jgi:hypothetical protein